MNPKENLLRAIRRDSPDHVPYGSEGVFREISFGAVEWPVEPGIDVWGTRWEKGDAQNGIYPYPVTHPLETLEAIDDFPFPDFEGAPFTVESQQSLAAPDRSEHILVGLCGETIFERAWMLRGMENLMVDLLTAPESVRQLLGKISDIRKTQVRAYIAAGVDMVLFCDDWGGQHNLLFSPDIWREFIKPEIAALYGLCRQSGILTKQHCCGAVESIFADLVELGLDIWDPCQPTSNDLAALKCDFGDRITFWGGIDSAVLDCGSPDDVRAEVRQRIRDLAFGGGYIAGPSHSVPYSDENINAMQDEIKRVGRYGSPEYEKLFV